VEGDIRDRAALEQLLDSLTPDCIVHLAALNHGTLKVLLETNVLGTENLLIAARKASPECRILVVGSSAAYGHAGGRPIAEKTPLIPLSEYGVSKAAQEMIALQHRALHGMQIAVARPFNLVGPGQPESFICGRIVRQVALIEKAQKNSIDLFEIRSARDFIDVRDVAPGYWAILSHPEFERLCAGKAFNLGSGRAYSVAEVIATIEDITGRHFPVTLPEQEPRIPIPTQRSDNTRIQSVTGWRPCIPLRNSLKDMLEAARKKET
jgi:GDP-4-dehydro-6-deoxy-D-mannose reductase